MIPPIIKELFSIEKLDVSLSILMIIILIGLVGPLLYPVSPTEIVSSPEHPPSRKFPLGTDSYGRDLLAQLIHGIHISLRIGATAALIALAIGVLVGAISGY